MKITLKDVRLSFPALWKAKAINDGAAKFSCSLLLNKESDAAQITAFRAAAKEVAIAQWPTGIPKSVKNCIHEGSEKDYDGYDETIMFVSASSNNRVPIVDIDRTPLAEADGKPYAGCFVNAVVRLWAQDNQFGKRVNAQLCGVQFVRDGESFGEKPFSVEDEFEDLSAGVKGNGGVGTPEDEDIPFAANYL